jgi:Undecaprenyl-phosphate galactose phosphotransferase WbaP
MTPIPVTTDAALAAAALRTAPGSRWLTRCATLLADLVAIALAITAAVVLRKWLGGAYDLAFYAHLWPALGLFLLLYTSHGLYAELPPPPSGELRRATQATSLGFVFLAAFTFVSRDAVSFSRLAFILAWLMALVTVPLCRAALRATCSTARWWGTPVVILGAGATAAMLIRRLRATPALGLKPCMAFDDDPAKIGTTIEGVPVAGPIAAAVDAAARLRISHAVVAMPGASPERLQELWRDLGPRFPHLMLIPGLMGFASLWVEAKDVGGMLGLEVRQSLLMPGPRAAKRALDLVVVALLAPLLIPLTALFSLLIAIDSPGNPFYGQRRLGRDGRPFTAWKFRSMRPDADAVLAACLAGDAALREEWERDHKLRRDPRITRVGRLLRKTSLDELPQLWNIVAGEMSLVGPRPIVEAEVAKYGPHFDLYARVRPGLTGLWQVSGRNNLTYDERVALDAYYVRNWSVWLDLFIAGKTVRVVLRGEGAY